MSFYYDKSREGRNKHMVFVRLYEYTACVRWYTEARGSAKASGARATGTYKLPDAGAGNEL